MGLATNNCGCVVVNQTNVTCPKVVACITAQPIGAPAAAGDLVLGNDAQFHALPAVPFATPAETIAGSVTGKAVNPAGLTAKLANQPAAGACTDREDVVWNGAILQGAAKHYEFSGSLGYTPTYAPGAGYVWQAGLAGKLSGLPVTISNPSNCRTLRVEIIELSSRLESISLTSSGNFNQFASVSVGGIDIAESLGAAIYPGTRELLNNFTHYRFRGYYDIPPSGSAAFVLSNYIKYGSGTITFNVLSSNYAVSSFKAYTI